MSVRASVGWAAMSLLLMAGAGVLVGSVGWGIVIGSALLLRPELV